jgi:Arc/MetJ family transcription regulator
MRTSIELDDDLMQEAWNYSTARTKRGLIEEALLTFIKVQAERRRVESYGVRLRDLQGRLGGLKLRDAPHALLRRDRMR